MRSAALLFAALFAAILTPSLLAQEEGPPIADEPVAAARELSIADTAWQLVVDATAQEERPGKGSVEGPPRRDGEQVSSKARQFYTTFPNDPRAGKARRVEIESLLTQEESTEPETIEASEKLAAYLRDESIPLTERFEVSAFAKEEALRKVPRSSSESRSARAAQARELIQEFPNDPRGYGYMLSVAKSLDRVQAKEVASEILSSSAPEALKAGARRLLDRLALEGKPLSLQVSEWEASSLRGHPVVVYSWSLEQPAQLYTIRDLARNEGVEFVGVNLDEDRAAAESVVRAMQIPGTHFFERGGMDGPIAQQLHLTMTSSIMLVDRHGKVLDVSAHENANSKLLAALGAKGGRP